MRTQPSRVGGRTGRGGGKGIHGEKSRSGHIKVLRHARRGGWFGKALYDPGRAIQRCGRGAALASFERKWRLKWWRSGGCVRKVYVQRHRSACGVSTRRGRSALDAVMLM